MQRLMISFVYFASLDGLTDSCVAQLPIPGTGSAVILCRISTTKASDGRPLCKEDVDLLSAQSEKAVPFVFISRIRGEIAVPLVFDPTCRRTIPVRADSSLYARKRPNHPHVAARCGSPRPLKTKDLGCSSKTGIRFILLVYSLVTSTYHRVEFKFLSVFGVTPAHQ